MNRRGAAGALTRVSGLTVAVIVVLSLVGCSGEDKTGPQDPSGSASSSPAQPKDESEAVLGWTPPAPVGRTAGRLAAQVSQGPTVPSTAEIISVRAGDNSTILTWQLSSRTDITAQGVTLNSIRGARFWPDAVRLIDPIGEKSYAVNTMDVDDKTFCVCSKYPIHVGPVPVQMTSEYPALPATATTISVRIPHFAPVTVPVTRS